MPDSILVLASTVWSHTNVGTWSIFNQESFAKLLQIMSGSTKVTWLASKTAYRLVLNLWSLLNQKHQSKYTMSVADREIYWYLICQWRTTTFEWNSECSRHLIWLRRWITCYNCRTWTVTLELPRNFPLPFPMFLLLWRKTWFWDDNTHITDTLLSAAEAASLTCAIIIWSHLYQLWYVAWAGLI